MHTFSIDCVCIHSHGFGHTVDCLKYWLPSVITNGTIGINDVTNGTIGRTLNDIGIPLLPLVES